MSMGLRVSLCVGVGVGAEVGVRGMYAGGRGGGIFHVELPWMGG